LVKPFGCRLDGGDAVGSFGGAVDSFDEGEAAAAFGAVAGGGAVVLDGLEKILRGRLGGRGNR